MQSDIEMQVIEDEPIKMEVIEGTLKPEQTVNITPTYEAQTVLPDEGMTIGRVNVSAIPDPTDEETFTENGDYNVARIGTAHVAVPQPAGKITISENGTNVNIAQYATADIAVPQGVFPAGTKLITENVTGEDVTNYAAVDVAVPGPSGTKQISITQNGTTTEDVTNYADAEITVDTLPAKGPVFEDYDSDGCPHRARFVGTWSGTFKSVQNLFRQEGFFANIKKLSVPEGITTYPSGGFIGNALEEIVLPSTLNTISVGDRDFTNCTALRRFIVLGDINKIHNRTFQYNTQTVLYDFSHCTQIPVLPNTTAALNYDTTNGCVIKIPSALSDTTLGEGNGWESETNWCDLTNIVWEVV